MVAPLVAAAAIPAVLGYAQWEQGHEDRRVAREMQKQALERYQQGLATASPEYSTVMPDDPALMGYDPMQYATADYGGISFDPTTGEAIQAGPSAMGAISLDPEARKAQMAALERMQGLSETGVDATDEARLAEIQSRIGRQERGSREAISQNMAERGIRGSGLELAAQLSANQAASERAQQESLGVNAQAQQRALQAIMSSGQMGSQMRGQDFDEQARVAQAQDAIARFNAQQQTGQQSQNLAAQNQAKMMAYQQQMQSAQDAANAQNLTGLGNIEAQKYGNQLAQQKYGNQMGQTQYQNQLKDQDFQNTMSKITGQMGASRQGAQDILAQQQQQQQMVTQAASGIGQGTAGYLDYKQKQDELDWKKSQAAKGAE